MITLVYHLVSNILYGGRKPEVKTVLYRISRWRKNRNY